jgi:hypothetical protein
MLWTDTHTDRQGYNSTYNPSPLKLGYKNETRENAEMLHACP